VCAGRNARRNGAQTFRRMAAHPTEHYLRYGTSKENENCGLANPRAILVERCSYRSERLFVVSRRQLALSCALWRLIFGRRIGRSANPASFLRPAPVKNDVKPLLHPLTY